MPVRLIATDVDGTFAHARVPSPANVRAAVLAAEAGVPLVFATGRPWRWLAALVDLVPTHPLAITSNGAALYDLAGRRQLRSTPIDPAVARAVVAELRAAVPGALFGLEFGVSMLVEPGFWSPSFSEDCPEGDVLEGLGDGAPELQKLMARAPLGTEELFAAAAPVVGGRLAATYSFLANPGLLEFASPGVTKATALAALCADLGIDLGDVVAFGDMPNDLELLQSAGRGFVMPDAHPRLLASGLAVLTGDPTDAVGRAIVELLANG